MITHVTPLYKCRLCGETVQGEEIQLGETDSKNIWDHVALFFMKAPISSHLCYKFSKDGAPTVGVTDLVGVTGV